MTHVVPLVVRELVRQGFLLAARDELGLSTRDVLLREEFPEKPEGNSVPFLLFCRAVEAKEESDYEYTLSRVGAADKILWRGVWKLRIFEPESLKTMAEKAEAASRRELKEVLTQSGWKRDVPAARATSEVPSATLDLLWSWNEISVLAGVRRLHLEIRTKGESPELLGALAIGYANLGTLTEYWHSAASRVFFARSLLYAERLVRKTEQSPWALWHRAYARMQLGLHNFGADDIAAAKQKQGTAPASRPLPFWTGAIDAFGQGDLGRMLDEAKTPPQVRLVRWLHYQAVEFGQMIDLKVRVARDLIRECPECPRPYDSLAVSGQLGPGNQGAYSTFPVTSKFLRTRLLDVSGLPEPTAKRIRNAEPSEEPELEIDFRKSVIEDLKQAGKSDRDEPSLSAIGHALEEINFAQVLRRIEFDRNSYGLPVENLISSFGPLVAAHPYAAYVDTFAGNKTEMEAAAAKLLPNLQSYELTFKQRPIIAWIYRQNHTKRLEALYDYPTAHADMVFNDEMRSFEQGVAGQPDGADVANKLYMVNLWRTSNKLPLAVAMRISRDWEHAQKEADAFERSYADDPLVTHAFFGRYLGLKRFDEAERYAKREIQLLPSYPAYRQLATIYKQKNDHARWKETLDKAIELPPLGLEQASLQNELALDLIQRHELKEAAAYADAAAESYSAWSMITATRCHELLGEWKKAEQFIRAVAQRYAGSMFDWTYWCHRTGHGDIAAADKFTRESIEAWGTNLFPSQYRQIGEYYLLIGDSEKALLLFQRSFEKSHAYYAGFHAALVADTLGKTVERDAILQQIIATKPSNSPSEDYGVQIYLPLAVQFNDVLAAKGAKQLDLAAIEKLATATKDQSPSLLRYAVGVFLKNRGDLKNAKQYLIACAHAEDWELVDHVLACQLLREMKVTIPPADEALKSGEAGKGAAAK